MAAFGYPAYGLAQRAEVPNYTLAAAFQSENDLRARAQRQAEISQALEGAGRIYGGISNVMNPETKPGEKGYRDPLSTGFRALRNRLGGSAPAATPPQHAAPGAVNPAMGGSAPARMPVPAGTAVRGSGMPAGMPRVQGGGGLVRQAAMAESLRRPATNLASAAPSAAPAATSAASTAGKVAGGVGQGMGYAGAALQGADAISRYRAGDTYGAGKSGASALGSGLMTAGLANAYNPLGWGLMAGGAAASLYGMFG